MKAALLLLAWCWNPLVYADRRGGGTGGGGPSGLKGFLGSWGEDRGRDRGDRSDRRFPRERDGDWDRDRDSFVRDRRDGDWRDGDRGRDSRDSRDSRDRSVDRDRDRGRSVGGATWNDLALVVTGKLLSYAAFALAFRLISRSLASSWTKAVSDISTTKSPLSPNITQYLAPNCTLNSYEEEILSSVTLPVGDSFADVGGLFSVKQQVLDLFVSAHARARKARHGHSNPGHSKSGSGATVIGAGSGTSNVGFDSGNSSMGRVLDSALYRPVKSLLLYGPPGCGKSMLVRALCQRLHTPMLAITPSLLLRMYVGETPRLTKALFSVAAKLQPCVLLVDEMDSLFCARGDRSNDVVDRKVITEFMQLWDELLLQNADVFVVGATNRPQDLDPAIQRRFERSFLIPPPDAPARRDVLQKLLRGVRLAPDIDFDSLAERTEGYSPSDLSAVCRAAAFLPMQEALRRREGRERGQGEGQEQGQGEGGEGGQGGVGDDEETEEGMGLDDLRPLTTADLHQALSQVFPTAWASGAYGGVGGGMGMGGYNSFTGMGGMGGGSSNVGAYTTQSPGGDSGNGVNGMGNGNGNGMGDGSGSGNGSGSVGSEEEEEEYEEDEEEYEEDEDAYDN